MNQPNILDLIKNCEVEWKPLREIVTTITAPSKVKKDIYRPVGEMPIIDQGIDFIAGYTDENYKAVEKGEYVIFGDHSEHIKYVNFSFVQGADGLKILKVKNNVSKYIYYAFLTFYKKELNYKRHWSTAKETLIPLPPLEIQQKIVKILDKFTELEATLEATLEAELTLRKKQYEFYLNQLLTFGDNSGRGGYDAHPLYKALSAHWNGEVVWKSLGEVGQLVRGNGLQKKDFTEIGVPAIHYGQIYTHFGTFADKTKSFVSENLAKKLKKAQYGDVLIAGTSENVQDVMKPLGWLGQEIVFSGDMFAFRPNKEIDTKYLTYLLQAENFQKYKEKFAQGTKVIRMKSENFLKYQIPIPPLAVQQKIVEILDKFDTLTHSISQGLPREIELRHKQYEYYRERLLEFANDRIEKI